MAEKLDKIYRKARGFLPMRRLGEYPDKIGGYHGCLPWHHGSSLKLQGNRTKLPEVTAAINEAMEERATVP